MAGFLSLRCRRGRLGDARARSVVGDIGQGRPIVAIERGDPSAGALLVDRLHPRDECAGMPRRPRCSERPPAAGACRPLARPDLNPDGRAAGHPAERARRRPEPQLPRRLDAARAAPATSQYYSGPRPFSEPETQAVRRLISGHPADGHDLVPPAHGHRLDVRGEPRRWAERYATMRRACRLLRSHSSPGGTASHWQYVVLVPGLHAFVGRAARPGELSRRGDAPPCERRARDGQLPETFASTPLFHRGVRRSTVRRDLRVRWSDRHGPCARPCRSGASCRLEHPDRPRRRPRGRRPAAAILIGVVAFAPCRRRLTSGQVE